MFHGIVGGLVSAGLLLGLYARQPESVISGGFFLCFAVIVLTMILSGWQERRINKGVFPFNKAFRVLFLTSVIAFVTLYAAQLYLMTNDPDLLASRQMMDVQQGTSQIQQEAEAGAITYNFRNIMYYFMVPLGFSLVFSVFSALVLKRSK